jgi:hypothetical protein
MGFENKKTALSQMLRTEPFCSYSFETFLVQLIAPLRYLECLQPLEYPFSQQIV